MKQDRHLLLWERMGDYHRARWKALGSWLGEDRCFAADLGMADELYKWEQTANPGHEILVRKPVEKVKAWEAFRAFRRLVIDRKITHVSIPGYGRPAYLLMLVWSRLTGRKVLMFAESWYPGGTIKDFVKGLFLRLFTNRCFVSGERARFHFIDRLRYPESRLQTGYSVVDNDHFRREDSPPSPQPEDRPVLLCVARFVPEKNLVHLLEAFKKSSLADTWKLILIGGGPLKAELEERARGSSIELRDWVGYNDLPALYREASCFVLPSQFEPWGLVINEAMASGLPLILSEAVGAVPDLLIEKGNGWSFNPENPSQLSALFERLSDSSSEELRVMGERSQEIIRHYSLLAWSSTLAHGRYCWKKMEIIGEALDLVEVH